MFEPTNAATAAAPRPAAPTAWAATSAGVLSGTANTSAAAPAAATRPRVLSRPGVPLLQQQNNHNFKHRFQRHVQQERSIVVQADAACLRFPCIWLHANQLAAS